MRRSRILLSLACVALLSGCAGNQLVSKQNRSVHFEKTAKHLDLGGTVFVYADIAGDFEKLAVFADEIIKQIAALEKDEQLSKIDFKALFAKMGFQELQSVGLSSYQQGKLFHNKAFLLYQGPRKGFMKATGGAPHAFEVPVWAPADADLAFEKDFNGRAVFEVASSMMRDVMGVEADEILARLDEPIPGFNLTIRKVIEAMDTRMVGVVRVDGSKIIHLPGDVFDFPFTELVFAIDEIGFVFDELIEKVGALPMVAVKKDDRFHTISVTLPIPGDLSAYQPVLAKDIKTGRVYLATTRAFLDEMKAGEKSLGKTAAFAQATTGLPSQGNALVFMSDKFMGKLGGFLTGIGKRFPEAAASIGLWQSLLPEQGHAMAQVMTNLPEGIYFASNSSDSHKSTLLTAVYANPAVIGILAAVAIPAFIKYQEKASAAALIE